ncbi:MAG TPA: radical SAM protein [Candidatus Sulfotelmatobacter sp.]|nr:radical SAM protein [Candidatus Sulfotelmatobacter sp.]
MKMESSEQGPVDVLLTHSYHLYYDRKQTRKMQPYPPLGTLYAAALLRSAGLSIALFDTMLTDPERHFEEALDQYKPRVVVVYEDNFNFLTKMCLTRMRGLAFRILELSQKANAMVLANGSDASDHTLDYLRHGFDYVLLGEAETTLLEVVRHILNRDCKSPRSIQGLAYLDEETGELVRTQSRPLMQNLDVLPFPSRDLLDVDQYRSAWESAHGYFSLNIVASRGCPYRCNWCAKPIYGDSFAVRAPQNVAAEMHELKYRFGAAHLWFADDIFGLRPPWVRDLAAEVERLDAAIPFKMQSRVDLMTPGNVNALRRAGCAEAWLGVESGSQKILDAMDKGTRVEQITKARKNLRNEGIRACYFLQFGYPGETWDDIQKTIELVRETRPDDIGVSVSYPLPGTKFFQRVHGELGQKSNWSDSEDLSMMFRGAYTDTFYRALHDFLHALVDSWNAARVEEGGYQDRSCDLWKEVVALEKVCRNSYPTILPEPKSDSLVQLQSIPLRAFSS